jgi:REP element-mobilizing transposase RayT
MNRDKAGRHDRRSIRLPGYDYSQAGAYFVTVVAQNRLCLFGDIENGTMRLNEAGQMVEGVWDAIPAHYPGVDVDAFVLMPNHVHGVIVLGDGLLERGPAPAVAPPPTLSVGDVMHRFKTMTTKRYADGVRQRGWTPFPGRLWQRNYYEHIIRDESALQRIREYIAENPARWDEDQENPGR